MRTCVVIGGAVLIICGLIGVGYAAITTVQPNAAIGWAMGLLLIIIGSYVIGKEWTTKSK